MNRPTCAECGRTIVGDTACYDDHGERYFCDGHCFYGWAGRNPERIEDFYANMNVCEVTLD